MTKPTKEQIEVATGEQLSEWVAVWCMEMKLVENISPPHYITKANQVIQKEDWQPHLTTEKGDAQCWSLAVKMNLNLYFNGTREYPNGASYYNDYEGLWVIVRHKNIKIAVLRACLYSVIGEE